MNHYLTVEVHDVTPAASAEIGQIREALAKIGIDRPTLLVVPAFEDRSGRVWDLRDDRDMVRALRKDVARGAEVVLHGLSHRAPGPPPYGVRNWVMHHWFSRGCAEFAHLGAAEASRRLREGRRILEDVGFSSEGFIAPAWQQSRAALNAVKEAGFRFTAFFNHVLAIDSPRERFAAPVLTFAAPNPLTDQGKRIVMRAIEAAAHDAPLVRIAIHPEDVGGAKPLDHAIDRIRHLLERRQLVTYREWLEQPEVRA